MGIEGYLLQHEWCLYVLESVPMFVALSALAWFHPVKHLRAKRYFDENNTTKEGYAPASAGIPMQA